jgi:hypothetical protein
LFNDHDAPVANHILYKQSRRHCRSKTNCFLVSRMSPPVQAGMLPENHNSMREVPA